MTTGPAAPPALYDNRNVALVDLLDRLLAGGVVIAGEITLGIADVDLVRISLRALVATIRAAGIEAWEEDG
ncbi:gas vesicle protein [Streptacidiphilus neutrinimicus]|uniref:gas vesicle protein n=1 Tax=Streptacidiphilus neutrinimicus TaxID=105420 RepID=UPI0005AA7AF7|nr:gas vesicle protein [Streptacidiphilus neutrinimicus]